MNFENSFKLTKLSFLVSGIDVANKERFYIKSIYYFNIIWLYTDVLGEFYWLYDGVMMGKGFEELSIIVPCCVICFLGTIRSAPLFFYRSNLLAVWNKLRELQPKNESEIEDKENDTEVKIVSHSVKWFSNIVHFMVTANTSVLLAFCLLPLLIMGLDYRKTGEVKYKLPFLVKYFFDPYTPVTWPLVYLHHFFSPLIVMSNLFGADTFFHAFCIYMRMHFKILCNRIENFVTASAEETSKRLRACVLRHQELIALVDQMEQLYSTAFLFNFLISSVLICLSGFNIVSSRVAEAIFKSRWYDADLSIRKSLLIILLRSQKPCSLTAAKFATINLSAFTKILSRSWSYFALLKTMYD
ncbi:unnamed protein product [Leptosia nina]|uniref:Odorant receptor n=1 Tax=Leptosia nina TaxID=320188 RepID=A0AAV1JGP3_9NEOP